MKLWPRRLSLSSRYLLSVALLLTVLVGAILFVIQKREVSIISEQSRNRGVLIARHIANLNLEPLMFRDEETIKKNIDAQVDEGLLYIMFFDRFNAPLVATESARGDEEVVSYSHLPAAVDENTVHFEPRTLPHGKRKLHVLEVEIPVFAKGSTIKWGSIKIGLSLEDMRAEVTKTRLILIVIGLAGLLLGLFSAAVLGRRIARPIERLVAGTIRVSRGDFSHQIPSESSDEIGDLARSFNEMSAHLLRAQHQMEEANKRLVQVEKLASIGRMAATIAHEIRNPLTSVKLNIQRVFLTEALDETEREHLKISQEGIGQIERFIKDLLNFTRASELNLNRFSMEQIVEESIKLLRDSCPEKAIVLERDFEPGLPEVLADGDKMRQVISNVLRNSYEAVADKGLVRVSLRISDDGPGIPDTDWENIFEPFFTTKSSGVGLGLSNARKILEQHGGTIRVVRNGGNGAAFEILLPVKGVP
jgi:signal transduction histidine kinase